MRSYDKVNLIFQGTTEDLRSYAIFAVLKGHLFINKLWLGRVTATHLNQLCHLVLGVGRKPHTRMYVGIRVCGVSMQNQGRYLENKKNDRVSNGCKRSWLHKKGM
jgi:hypothetical protein